MTNIRVMLVAVLAALLLSACGAVGTGGELFKSNPGEQKLSVGVASYDEGDYKSSMAELQRALDLGLNNKRDQVLAHKYLAFIHCVSGREKQCRDEFTKALEVEPAFDLKPEEAGHPIWGPVFRSVKAKYAK
jgi:Tfp pilus assembly protein PilF